MFMVRLEFGVEGCGLRALVLVFSIAMITLLAAKR